MIKTTVAFLESRLLSSQLEHYLKSFQKALIGWKKAGSRFDHVSRLKKISDRNFLNYGIESRHPIRSTKLRACSITKLLKNWSDSVPGFGLICCTTVNRIRTGSVINNKIRFRSAQDMWPPRRLQSPAWPHLLLHNEKNKSETKLLF